MYTDADTVASMYAIGIPYRVPYLLPLMVIFPSWREAEKISGCLMSSIQVTATTGRTTMYRTLKGYVPPV